MAKVKSTSARRKSAAPNSRIRINTDYEDWANRKWRPYTAWTYLAICVFDFILAPVITFYFFGGSGQASYLQWQPITLVGSGLFHIAMGAIIGVTAWQRGEERKYPPAYMSPTDNNYNSTYRGQQADVLHQYGGNTSNEGATPHGTNNGN